MNWVWSKLAQRSALMRPALNAYMRQLRDISYVRPDLTSQVGNCIPLSYIRMGSWIHDIEWHLGQGAKLARSAGTCAKIIKEQLLQCLVQLPSGIEKLLDSRCRATVCLASNPEHGARKLRKAGQSQWLGRRPVVRGVAMNHVDHPHGGSEGCLLEGRPLVTPWGKPTQGGFKTVLKIASKDRI